MPKQLKIIVGSGWWCSNRADSHNWLIGSDKSKGVAFFDFWCHLVEKYIRPERIIIIDSCSPIKPDVMSKKDVQWIELDHNYGHAMDIRKGKIKSKYCGFTRSVFLGATYALACDADYFIYVEQDCAVYGESLVETLLAPMTEPILLGQPTINGVGLNGGIAASMYQQSLIVVRKDGLERFIASIYKGDETDGELSPEVKFARDLKPFGLLPIPFGRSRPLDLSLPCFYAQHLTDAELSELCKLEGWTLA